MSFSLHTGNETKIPRQPTNYTVPPNYSERIYIISVKVTDGYLQFYFKERPKLPDSYNDGPLQARVPADCLITLKLDPNWNWEFRYGEPDAIENDAITVQDNVSPGRYDNLDHFVENGRCRQVSFTAKHATDPYGHCDNFNIYVNLDQVLGAPPKQLAIRIDPDIKNPGVTPQMGGT